MTKSREQPIDDMLDREAMRDLAIPYCDYIWHDEISQLKDTFTADGAFISALASRADVPTRGEG